MFPLGHLGLKNELAGLEVMVIFTPKENREFGVRSCERSAQIRAKISLMHHARDE